MNGWEFILNQRSECKFESYRADLKRYFSKMLSSSEDADDLLQETYSRVYKRLSVGEHLVTSHRAYIFVTASNLVRDYLRVKQRNEKYTHISVEDVSLECERKAPDGTVVTQQLKNDIKKGLQNLDEKVRIVFVMHKYQHMTHAEISNRLNISVRTVERRMKIAIEHFRCHLQDYL